MQAAEDAWNTREPGRVALAYTEDSVWRNRDQHVNGLMRRREASINDLAISESDRRIFGPRPEDERELLLPIM